MTKYYIDINNNWDTEREANSAVEAIRQVFPKATAITFDGIDDDGCDGMDYSVYMVENDGEMITINIQ